ncbi:MAG: bifunctional enoyl-CoA hydratase/phosphate acetyltransferase [Vicinamibacterales bacterium]
MIASFTELIARAKALGPARIVVVEAHDPDVLESLGQAEPLGLVTPVLVGNRSKIEAAALKVGYALKPESLVPTTSEEASVRQAVDLVREDKADLLMKGKVTTATLIRGIVDKERGLRTGSQLSQVIVFQVPHLNRLMIMTDAAINIAPTLAQKADITRNAIMVAHALGNPAPNVALLTALEFVNPDMPATVDAAALAGMNRRGQITGAYLEGPIALDVPMSRFAADRKNIQSPIVEATDVFICPDIEAANIMFRAILYFGRGESGGIVVGAKVPLVLLSRAESAETKIHSMALALLVRKHQRG